MNCIQNLTPSLASTSRQRIYDGSRGIRLANFVWGVGSAAFAVATSSRPLKNEVGPLYVVLYEAGIIFGVIVSVQKIGRLFFTRCAPVNSEALKQRVQRDAEELPFDRFWDTYQLGKRDLSKNKVEDWFPIGVIEGAFQKHINSKLESLEGADEESAILIECDSYFGPQGLGTAPDSTLKEFRMAREAAKEAKAAIDEGVINDSIPAERIEQLRSGVV